MPCDAPWAEEGVELFPAWIDAGMPAWLLAGGAARSGKRLDAGAVSFGYDEHSRYLGDAGQELAGEAEHGRLVGGAVTDRERATLVGRAIEDPAQPARQTLGILAHGLRVCLPQRGKLAAAGGL
jgi:hypothetical protein